MARSSDGNPGTVGGSTQAGGAGTDPRPASAVNRLRLTTANRPGRFSLPQPDPVPRRDLGPRPEPVGRVAAARARILPRSVLGIASLILALAVGAGFSGVVLFSYYQYKLNQTNDQVNTLISGYKKQFANAEGKLSAAVAAAKTNIQNQLKAVAAASGRAGYVGGAGQAGGPVGVLRAHPRRQRAARGRARRS